MREQLPHAPHRFPALAFLQLLDRLRDQALHGGGGAGIRILGREIAGEVEELRPFTGLDESVRDYVLSQPLTSEFLAQINGLLETLLPAYVAEGKSYLTVAFGCTGGRHRSVAIAEAVAEALRERGFHLRVTHRDLDR